MNKTKKCIKTFIFIGILFFLFGGITVLVQLLVPHLKDIFELNYAQAGFILFFFFLPYLLFSIPAGVILSKIGYQRSITLGLIIVALGAMLFYPAAEIRSFWAFMTAIFILGSGVTLLQVAANPYIAALGRESSTSSRLNFSQAFNSLGTTFAPIIGAVYLLKDEVKTSGEIQLLDPLERNMYLQSEALTIQTPFLYISLIVIALAVVFGIAQLPCHSIEEEVVDRKSYFSLLKRTSLVLGAIAIFLYVGAEVAIGSFAINYLVEINMAEISQCPIGGPMWKALGIIFNKPDLINADPKAMVAIFLCFYWGGAMVGRFIGARLSRRFSPSKMLITVALCNVALILLAINTTGLFSMISLLSVGLFNSIMFPTIFALACEGIDELKSQASGVLCTMIVGGGLIPILFGFFTDHIGFILAFLTLVVCYGYIAFFGFYKSSR